MDKQFSEELFIMRKAHAVTLSNKNNVHHFADDLIELFFPHFCTATEYFSAEDLQGKFALLARDLKRILQPQEIKFKINAEEIATRFFNEIPQIYRKLWKDAEAIYEGDPAAESIDEVISAYPGFFAIYISRIAHLFYQFKVPVFPRVLSEYAHVRTGIDIHPGAKIGDAFFIDHGTGVVIGETAIIGNNVKIYQGVTLGALSVNKELRNTKRHPTIEDNVVIYSNAVILGGETRVGHDSVIGGNVWLTESVPPYSTVFHKSELKIKTHITEVEPINFVI